MALPRALAAAATLVVVLLAAACAERPADGRGGDAPQPLPEGLVLQVEHIGGSLPPEMSATRLPVVSVYGDGRVTTQGPVIAIYPAPALPNVQVGRVDQATVRALVDRALAAGVAERDDLGDPPVADAPSTRFTVVTSEETHVREVYALHEGSSEGLTPEQQERRAALRALLQTIGSATDTTTESYTPEALAVIARPWTDADGEPELPQAEVAWPGPALPGEPFEPPPGLSCLTLRSADTSAVLTAAATANALTPWVAEDGSRWALAFRPLLPHESGCADLRGD